MYTTAGWLLALLRVKAPADVPSRITMNRDPSGDNMDVNDIPVPLKRRVATALGLLVWWIV